MDFAIKLALPDFWIRPQKNAMAQIPKIAGHFWIFYTDHENFMRKYFPLSRVFGFMDKLKDFDL